MLLESKLDRVLTLVISSDATKDHDSSDTFKLMESYGIIEKAKDAFLSQEITFDEYLQLCELHEVNVDGYMKTIEHNLVELKLM